MKKLLLIAVTILTLISTASAKKNESVKDLKSLPLEINSKREEVKRPRIPAHVSLEAYYDEASKSITVLYDGEAEGTTSLYYDGTVIASEPEINTSFELPYESGSYKIEVETDSWTATGNIQL